MDPRQRHAAKRDRIASQLRRHRGDRPLSLRKRAVSHVVPKRHDLRRGDDKVDISDLDEILSIDLDAMTCTAEPGVTFRDLVDATLRLGVAPIIVPELSTITIGGAVAGCSLESMSFRHGGFHDTCTAYEVITARGDVLSCTPDNEHRLIFEMVHGSFGTLGILSQLTFRLIPVQPFVHVEYERHRTLDAYLDAIARRTGEPEVDFIDGIIHAPDCHVLSVGRFARTAPYTHRYDWVKVYYQTTARRAEDYLATRDYYLRYDRGVTNPFPRTALGRLVFGKFIRSTEALRLAELLHRWLPSSRPDVTLDVFIPMSRVVEFMDWYRRELGHFPLWCVPYKLARRYPWLAPGALAGVDDTMFLDLAIYGMKQRDGRNVYAEIEDELEQVHGIKTLISYNYYDEDRFWTIWNRDNYDAVKAITDPDNRFRDLYDKTCRASLGLAR